jgi:hypothetical protein
MAVRAAAFIGHPIGPHVAFFEDVDAQTQCVGNHYRSRVDLAGVATSHDIGDAAPRHDGAKGVRPVIVRIAKGNIARRAKPERAVTCIEPDTPDLRTSGPQHLCQMVLKRPVRSLQEQKLAFGWIGHGINLVGVYPKC